MPYFQPFQVPLCSLYWLPGAACIRVKHNFLPIKPKTGPYLPEGTYQTKPQWTSRSLQVLTQVSGLTWPRIPQSMRKTLIKALLCRHPGGRMNVPWVSENLSKLLSSNEDWRPTHLPRLTCITFPPCSLSLKNNNCCLLCENPQLSYSTCIGLNHKHALPNAQDSPLSR